MNHSVFIVSAVRTPIGSFQGSLATLSAPQLGAIAIKEALNRAQIAPHEINECIMGQVLTAGSGQAPARQAALAAQLPPSAPCMTINKVCGSGLKAVLSGADSVALGRASVVVAGGQESMSCSPYLLPQARQGYRMGHGSLIDSMIFDGLWDPYNNFHMGLAAELCVKEFQITREEQDRFAVESYRKAQQAQKEGFFKSEMAPVTTTTKEGAVLVENDEEPGKVKFDKISSLKPAFDKQGTITAANASKINDGASALLLMSEETAKRQNKKPLARIVSSGYFAQDPKWFTTAPVEAMKRALTQAGLSADKIDLWEINEAFSVVTMISTKQLGIDPNKVNIFGGAVALGHPIGASGARILTTLVHALHTKQKKYGVASLCIGGGEGIAAVVERL